MAIPKFSDVLKVNAMMGCHFFEDFNQNVAVTMFCRGVGVFAVTADNQFIALQGFQKRCWIDLITLPHQCCILAAYEEYEQMSRGWQHLLIMRIGIGSLPGFASANRVRQVSAARGRPHQERNQSLHFPDQER